MISKFEKVKPRVPYFDYKKHHMYVYVYLNPFEEKYQKYNIQGNIIEFAYTPIYIGKGTSNTPNNSGYRLNAHIAEYLKNGQETDGYRTIHNETKRLKFKELENNMRKYGHGNVDLPKNWEEYKKQWIIVLKVFNNQAQLQRGEADLIKGIGTIRKGTGPLVNALLG